MRQIDSTAARIFVSVIEEGSIAKAAARENIVASAVSKRLGELESSLGMPLVERGAQGVTPTAAGEALVYHARLVLQALDRLHEEMAEYHEGVRGHIRVRASASALSAGLTTDIEHFLRDYHHVRIDLEEQETPRIIQEVSEGKAEIGVGPDLFRHESLQFLPYRRYQLGVVVPPHHPLATLEEVAFLQTLHYDQVEQSASSAISQTLDYAARQASLVKRTRIRVRGFETVCRMISTGMGVGVVPSFLEPLYKTLYGLKFIPLTDAWASPTVCIIVRDIDSLTSVARSFVDRLIASSEL
jgi:DNA-binding transcriptional LysR family regulator